MPIAGAVIAVAGSAYAANKQAKAAKGAANTQAQAAADANATQLKMYEQSRADAEPWRQAGQVGLNEYMALLGLQQPQAQPTNYGGYDGSGINPDGGNGLPMYKRRQLGMDDGELGQFGNFRGMNTGRLGGMQPFQQATAQTVSPISAQQAQQNAFAKFRANPGYQFGLDEGMKSVQASAAARGGLNSGAALKSLLKFGNDYADQQGFTPYMNRIASLANIGQTQNAQNAALGQNYANQTGANLNNAAQARAQGIYGQANAWSNFANTAANQIGGAMGGMWGGR